MLYWRESHTNIVGIVVPISSIFPLEINDILPGMLLAHPSMGKNALNREVVMKKKVFFFSGLLAALLIPFRAYAGQAGKIDTGDTAFILLSAALVMLMTPGLAMFYGGMVRRKNVLGTIMHSFVAIALVSVQWVLIGYSLSFGPDINGIIGNLSWVGL